MSAKSLYRESKEGIYSHIYNKGVESRVIFNDKEDYESFQGFLNDYLSPPHDPESTKKSFTVHGRIFRGTPHQPKNYFGKVELIAYSLMPCRFHLLLHQKTHGSLENFIRSLCTRYSIYFNKKYQRTGALFEGPYKSAKIKNEFCMLYLTRYFHRADGQSSYAQYLGKGVIPWVNTKIVLSFFDKTKADLLKGTDSYKDFVEKYEPDQKALKLLEGITFESEIEHLERIDLARGVDLKPWQRTPEIFAAIVVFLLFLTFGIRNIMISAAINPDPSALGTNTIVSATESPNPSAPPAVPSATKEIEPKMILTVKINDGGASVNIREKPTVNSEKIGRAQNGDTFEFIAQNSEWYEVKLATRSGFISAAYIEVGEGNK